MSEPICGANRNILAASVLVDELIRGGLRDVCLSPGSRCAPLTLAFARRSELRRHVHIDERCAGFFALGLARASRRPVALVCTSGSAAANYHPAVMEAFEARVPLLVLGADRPPQLVDSGANQTTEQPGLFGPHVLRSERLDLPRPEAPWLRWLRGRVCRWLDLATGPTPGPVHVNLPFDEPLSAIEVPGDVPAPLLRDEAALGRADGGPFAPSLPGMMGPSEAAMSALVRAFQGGDGLIVVGPLDAPPSLRSALLALGEALGAPIVADPLSGLRGSPGVVGAADSVLRSPLAERLAPAWVLAFGRPPVSRALVRFLGARPGGTVFQVDPSVRQDDPEGGGPTVLRAAPLPLVRALLDRPLPRGEGRLRARWRAVDEAARSAIAGSFDDATLTEGRAVAEVVAALPGDATLWVASSMPVRDLDTFGAGVAVRVLANRGVSGIDGLISATFGAEAGSEGPTFGLLGDLAALHDVGGLAAVRRLGARATLVVLNNGGGGIFEHLPLAGTDAPLGEFFVAEHEQEFAPIAAAFGLGAARVTTPGGLVEALAESIGAEEAGLIEVVVDRRLSFERRRAAQGAAAEAVSAILERA